MAAAVTFFVVLLTILVKQTQDLRSETITVQQMQQRKKFLQQEMMQLLQEIAWIESPQEAPFLSGLQLCLFWAAAVALLVEVCWLAWQMKFTTCTCYEQDTSGSEEEDDEEEKTRKGRRHSVRLFSVPNVMSMQGLSDMCRDVKKMTHDILRVCRVLSKNTFMPEIHPATGKNSMHESWSIFEDRILYQLLVFLKPPSRHSFKLELYGGTHLPEKCSNIRVVLECTCLRKMENIPCFVHPSKTNETGQHSPLLQNLCTGSYLDVEEIACWVQNSVQTAWDHLPQWQDWLLTMLPSSHSCRLLLSGPSDMQLCAVLVFAVEQGSPGTFLILQ
ncbi:inositol 1,4,5-trisphosphate receptor-interacting protein-like 1 [Anomalospiza imberbis]|uniref:inositol 1,4,5-trisphosphate receptor-interacting protein-like 1 n=1 Tax=Anomalospiza imberbis TaxID=187417 RepID=UPI00358E3D33